MIASSKRYLNGTLERSDDAAQIVDHRKLVESASGRCPMRWRFIVALAWSVVVFMGLLVLPTYSNGSTLFAVNGARAFVATGLPVLICSAPLVVSRKARIPAGAAVLAFVVIAGMSSGLLYTPCAAMLLWPHGKRIGPSE